MTAAGTLGASVPLCAGASTIDLRSHGLIGVDGIVIAALCASNGSVTSLDLSENRLADATTLLADVLREGLPLLRSLNLK